MSRQVRSMQGDTVDLICYRYFGRTKGVTEQVLELNPALALLGPILPSNTLITLPDSPAPAQQEQVQLWS